MSRERRFGEHGARIALAIGALACTRPTDGGTSGSTTAMAASAPKPESRGAKATDAPRESTVLDFLGADSACAFGHRGFLLDLGDATTRSRMSGSKLAAPEIEVREHEGASWASVRTRSLELSFVAPAEIKSDGGVVIEARMKGGLAKSASVYLNGKPIGTLPLRKGETAIVSARAPGTINKGANEVLLRFNGGGKVAHEQLAEIDWVHVGPNEGDAAYSAPTRGDAVTAVSIAGTQRRSVSLRAPGFARCTGFLPSGSVLEGFLGSTGEAEAEVRVLVDRSEPRVVGSFHLGGPTDPPGWRAITLPLGDIATIGAVELVAKESSRGARVAFAETRVVAPPQPAPTGVTPAARGVVLVVLGSTSRRMLGLHGGNVAMPELASLAAGGAVFESHRATSSFASGALASMLTGASPREHGASDADAALRASVFTVAEAARQAGVITAMFTANPSTSEPYGFARGWETFVSQLPSEDASATAIFDEVGRWIDAHKSDRFFIVVHARGGHPPWDVTSEELKDLPPAGYAGSMEPKHAGEALAKARKVGNGRMFADPDRERAFALYGKALSAHDAALGALVGRLRTLGRDKDTALLVTSDVGIDAAARIPFLEDESLEEGALGVPLVLRGPTTSAGPGVRVSTATSGVDVARTVLEALSLQPPPHLRGESLWTIAARKGAAAAVERPLIAATTSRFSARWAQFAVVGARERELKVCDLSLDPDCVSDVRPSHPLAAELLHDLAWTEVVTKAPPGPPPRAAVDGPTSAALRSWGR